MKTEHIIVFRIRWNEQIKSWTAKSDHVGLIAISDNLDTLADWLGKMVNDLPMVREWHRAGDKVSLEMIIECQAQLTTPISASRG